MSAATYIYALNDPETHRCKYIGKSDSPSARFRGHLFEATRDHTSPKGLWISGLLVQGRRPELEVLDEVPRYEWKQWEREYIRVFRAIGIELLNANPGGGGASEVKQSTRELLRRALTGKKKPEGHGAKIRSALLGRKRPAEVGEKIRLARLGSRASAATRAKMSAAHKGNSGRLGQRLPAAQVAQLVALNKRRCRDAEGKFLTGLD